MHALRVGSVWCGRWGGAPEDGRVSTMRQRLATARLSNTTHIYHICSAMPFPPCPFYKTCRHTHTPTHKDPRVVPRLFHGQDRLRTWFGRAGKPEQRKWRPLGTQFASTRPWFWYFGRGVCNGVGKIMRTGVENGRNEVVKSSLVLDVRAAWCDDGDDRSTQAGAATPGSSNMSSPPI